MVAMLSRDRERYPHFIRWLGREFPKVSSDSMVWGAFKNCSGWDDAKARYRIRLRTNPYIIVVPQTALKLYSDMANQPNCVVYGGVNPSFPNVIYLYDRIVRTFRPTDFSHHLSMECVLLHELVHIAWASSGRPEPTEMGDRFEQEAYGRSLLAHYDFGAMPQDIALDIELRRSGMGTANMFDDLGL